MEWIKPEESLPESCEVVFVAIVSIGKEVSYQVYTGIYFKDKSEWWLEGYGFTYNVYCWMHVPEIPKLEI